MADLRFTGPRMRSVPERTLRPFLARALAFVLLMPLLPACEQERSKAQPVERLTLAVTRYPGAAPAFVALAQGYFEQEGLKVTVQHHPTGKAALDAVLNGEAEVATAAELPVTLAVLKGYPVTIFATLSTQTDYAVLGRID